VLWLLFAICYLLFAICCLLLAVCGLREILRCAESDVAMLRWMLLKMIA